MKFRREPLGIVLILTGIILAGLVLYFCIDGIGGAVIMLADMLLPFLFGYIFMILTRPVSGFLINKLKIPRNIAAIAVLVVFFGIIGAVVSMIVIKAFDEARNFYLAIPHIYENTRNLILKFSDKWEVIYETLPMNIQNIISGMGANFSSELSDLLNSKSSPIFEKTGIFAKKLPGFFVGFIVFILSSYFFISDDGTVSEYINKIIPDKMSATFRKVGDEVKVYLGGYIKAQLSIMCVVFVILLMGFYIIRAEYALFAALIIALIDAIPFFGTGAALIPWAVFSFLSGDIRRGTGLVIIYLTVFLTRQLIEPKIISENIGMHPIATLVSMYAGYKFLSIGGMILGPVILMLIISFYRAGVFEKAAGFIKKLGNDLKRELGK